MTYKHLRQQRRFSIAHGLFVAAAMSCGVVLSGCGSGIASLLPGVSQPAAQGAPSGPVLGYVFSPTDGTLRAMLGVRGSAQMSASIVPSGVYVAGEASTAGSAALLVDGAGSLFAFNLPQSQPTHVADGFPTNSQVGFASSGKMAVVYMAGGSSLAVISGLPSSAQARSVGIPAGNALVSAVVSDAGTVVVATQNAVGILSASGQIARIATVNAFGGFNFIPGSDDLLVADAGTNTASLIRNISTAAAIQSLSVAGLNRPFAVAASQDRKWAVIADGGDAGIVRVDLTNGSGTTKVLCACQPSQLHSLAGGGTFRVNSLYAGPVWTVDLTGAAPQLLFVPAISKGTP